MGNCPSPPTLAPLWTRLEETKGNDEYEQKTTNNITALYIYL